MEFLDCYPSIVIVGGGVGGLALGIACSHRGIPFHVLSGIHPFSCGRFGLVWFGLVWCGLVWFGVRFGNSLGRSFSHPLQIFSILCSSKQAYGLTLQQAPSRALAAFGIKSLRDGVTSTKHVVHTPDGTPVGEWRLRKWGRGEAKKPPKRQNCPHCSTNSM